MKYFEQILDYKLIELKGFSLTLLNIFLILLIIITAKLVTLVIDAILKKRLNSKGIIDEGRGKSVSQIFKYIIYILSTFLVLESFGVDISIIFGVFAALGLGIGFALQDVFKDLISGIIILFEGNVSTGDILEIDELVGTVEKIKLRTSLIKTRDGIYMVIPNSRVVNDKVINWTANNKISRFKVTIGVAYGSDVEKVKNILLTVAGNNKMISRNPSPDVFFNDFGDSALIFNLQFWVLDIWHVELVKSKLRFAIDKLFRENKIQIPFPQRDVHLIQK